MAAYYLWLKGLHVVFMVTWFAGLFYLPRLFIYHTLASDSASRERFGVMEVHLTVKLGVLVAEGASRSIGKLHRQTTDLDARGGTECDAAGDLRQERVKRRGQPRGWRTSCHG